MDVGLVDSLVQLSRPAKQRYDPPPQRVKDVMVLVHSHHLQVLVVQTNVSLKISPVKDQIMSEKKSVSAYSSAPPSLSLPFPQLGEGSPIPQLGKGPKA